MALLALKRPQKNGKNARIGPAVIAVISQSGTSQASFLERFALKGLFRSETGGVGSVSPPPRPPVPALRLN